MSGQDTEFEAFANASDVQVGESNLASQTGDGGAEAPKPRARRAPPKPAQALAAAVEDNGEGGADEGADDGENLEDTGDQGGADEGTDDGQQRETPESRTKRLKRERARVLNENRELKARLAAIENGDIAQRLARLENGGLPPANSNATAVSKLGPSPDPMDQDKYPLGHLDARYVEDRIEWVADKKLAEQSDAALHRQQETQQTNARNTEQQRVLKTVREITDKGNEIYDDFQESVVDAGMAGHWPLAQATFEAAAEEEHGVRILYELAHNKSEAEKVAAMSPYKQGQYVAQRNSEIADKLKARRIPGAGAPPQTQARGGNSRTQISPATDNLDDFEKLVRQDAAKGRR